jgi:BirA family transcriptional regulator, biotin operon repressor / biotin---[acetyl-CoA-carboxylase] ligase
MSDPAFPPLMSGLAVTGQEDPFETACQRAVLGCDAGLVVHNLAPDCLRAALVFAPEVPLGKAMVMLPTCGIGLQNALGALAPPEVAVHLEWGGGLRINGARCGTLRVAASTTVSNEVPDWLVVGLQLPLWPANEDGGETPDETALYAEGCADVKAPALLESWARHTLHWISRWEEDGLDPLHAEWRGLAHGLGEGGTWYGATGTFLGVDEDFGMLLRDPETTHLIPLTTRLETL